MERLKGWMRIICGGMMILGNLIKDENGNNHKMSGILPFKSKKSNLMVGYRYLKGLRDTPLIKQNQSINHLITSIINQSNNQSIYHPIKPTNNQTTFPKTTKLLATKTY